MIKLVMMVTGANVAAKLANKALIVKHGANQQNKIQSLMTMIVLLPFALSDWHLAWEPLALSLIALGAIIVIATVVFRGKMLETIPGYVIQSVSIWVFIETLAVDMLIGEVPFGLLILLSILAKAIGMWWVMGAKAGRNWKIVGGVALLSALTVMRMYVNNILLNGDYISKWVLLFVQQAVLFAYCYLSYPKARVTLKAVTLSIPFVAILVCSDALNLIITQKGVHMSSDYGLLTIALITLIESRCKLEKKQWIGLGLLGVGWVIT